MAGPDPTQPPPPAGGGHLAPHQSGPGGRSLARPRRGRILAGVLAGIARRFGISPWAARAVFLLTLFLPGPQFLAYVVLWIAMPSDP